MEKARHGGRYHADRGAEFDQERRQAARSGFYDSLRRNSRLLRACSQMAALDNTALKLASKCSCTHLYTQIYTLGFFSQFRLVLSSFAYL
jgi:hypothetical protein